MALDPMIAGGFRGIEIQNPLEGYARIAQLQNLQQQNQLAALQMQKAQRDIEVENRLAQLYQRSGADPTSPEFMREVYAVSPARGAVFQKSAIEVEKEKRLAEAASEKLAQDRIATARSLLPSVTADTWSAWRADTLRKLPGLANVIPETYSESDKLRLMQTADQYLAERKPLTVAPGASVYRPGESTPMFTAPSPSKLLSKEEEEQRIRIAQASRPPREPVAPTITQIQDPTNPEQMITIDARRYVPGGGVGSPGVIGASGKTPKATADKMKQEQGISQASDILDNLETAYLELDRMRAIPSEQRGVISNVLSSIAASGVGQVAGRVTGTAEQSQRDIIASARNQMLTAMKNATGMSAQQLNSNVEFTTWLNSLTDPAKSIESNRAIIDNMRKFIKSGGKYSAKKPGSAASSSTAPAAGVDSTNPLLAD